MDLLKKIAVVLMIAGFYAVNAQSTLKYCGTTQANKKLKAEHPEYFTNVSHKQATSVQPQPQGTIYIIPIVFHIIHNYGGENISDEQVRDAVRILNEDFRKKNADTVDIVSTFKSIAADSEIEFRLPTLDPNGNCTNGIDRVASMETYIGDESSKLNQWPRDKYLNIWVVNAISSGAAGYAFYPSSADFYPEGDGIVILSTYVGSIGSGTYKTARALTHEIGHYLNLAHTWGETNEPGVAENCNDDDGVSDTPNTIGWTTCSLNASSCGSPRDNVQNHMEYAYCDRMFTLGQKQRMRDAITSSVAERENLWTTQNLLATGCDNASQAQPPLCSPITDFGANNLLVCEGAPIRFYDQTWNGKPSGWQWTFTGGTPAISTDSVQYVTYSTAGIYTVKLKSFNTSGSDSITKTSYITVLSATAKYNNTEYMESFESTAIPNSDWEVINKDNDAQQWSTTSTASYTGNKSIRMSFQSPTTYVDEIISPGINLAAISQPAFSFRLAHALANSSNNGKLEVLVSSDCGHSWQTRYYKSGNNIATAPLNTGVYVPVTADWRKESISLPASLTSKSNVLFKFRYTSGAGNYLYIDDINIESLASVEKENEFTLTELYPNPSLNGSFTLLLSVLQRSEINVRVYDVLGNIAYQSKKQITGGENKITIENQLTPGIYFVEISGNNNTTIKKLIVQ